MIPIFKILENINYVLFQYNPVKNLSCGNVFLAHLTLVQQITHQHLFFMECYCIFFHHSWQKVHLYIHTTPYLIKFRSLNTLYKFAQRLGLSLEASYT